MSEHEQHPTSFYVKVWAILVVLLIISVIGPTLGIQWVTLLTAFGIACVKAYLVIVNFMHLNQTPRFVVYMFSTSLIFMLLFFAGTAPDVMKPYGTNWVKPAWITAEAAYVAGEASGLGHGDGHGDDHGDSPAGDHR